MYFTCKLQLHTHAHYCIHYFMPLIHITFISILLNTVRKEKPKKKRKVAPIGNNIDAQ